MENRGKQKEKYKTHIKTPDFYSYYADMHFREYKEGRVNGIIDKESPYYVDYSTYCKIVDAFNLRLRDLILYDSFDYTMPARMGLLGIRKKRITPWIDSEGKLVNNLPIDWKKTKELWAVDEKAKEEKKIVRHYNKHSKGFVAKWYFSKRTATFKWKSAYSFIPCRTAKLELSKILKDEDSKIDYYLL